MQVGRMVRRRLRSVAAPAVFLLLVGYFLWNATQGAHGLHAYAERQQDLAAAQAELAQATPEAAIWERRVGGLRSRIDGDALDERARAMLNLSDPQRRDRALRQGQAPVLSAATTLRFSPARGKKTSAPPPRRQCRARRANRRVRAPSG